MNVINLFQKRPRLTAGLITALILVTCCLLIIASLLAIPERYFQPVTAQQQTLNDEQVIAGWVELDRPSYHIGEVIHQQLRILYRSDKVVPDMDNLRRRMSFFPLENRNLTETVINHPEQVVEYILDYELQAVRVEPQQTYRIDPFILYYSNVDKVDDNVFTYRIQTPVVHIGSFYPDNIDRIVLHNVKAALGTANHFRQSIPASSGLILLAVAGLLLWHYGRRRSIQELSEEEQLWRVFMSIQSTGLNNRLCLLNYEQVFTRLLFIQTGVTPESFWSGINPDDEEWKPLAIESRKILIDNYQAAEPDEAGIETIKAILEKQLTALVEESRLKIEQQPSFRQRLSRQPAVILHAGITAFIALILVVIAAVPDLWLSSELKNYNLLMANIESGDMNENHYLDLSAMGDRSTNNLVKFAALYNAGTLRSENSFSMFNPEDEKLILNTTIRSDTVENLFMVLLEDGPFDEESQIVSVLLDGAEQLRRAQLDLQASIRINPYDSDALRNHELILKRRDLILTRLGEIRQFYRSQQEGEEQEALSDQGIINLLEAELPEDDEEQAAGKDDRGYMILERF
ncbi:MAG: hypothetical protein HKN08_05610 [Gammaproteobacteria bacterium]|nr:hypothetical protein [Gammaproteobacteria bacterium]